MINLYLRFVRMGGHALRASNARRFARRHARRAWIPGLRRDCTDSGASLREFRCRLHKLSTSHCKPVDWTGYVIKIKSLEFQNREQETPK